MLDKKFDVIFYGMVIVDYLFVFDKFPQRFSITSAKQKLKKLGGSATNSATCISRWGVKTGLMGCHHLGSDVEGDFFSNALNEYAINTEKIDDSRQGNTHCAYILIDESGERTIIADPAPQNYISICPQYLQQSKLLCLDGYFARSAKFMQEAAFKAHELQVPIILSDTEPDEPHFTLANVVLVSRQTTKEKLPQLEMELLATYKDHRDIKVIVTLGSLGCMFVYRGECTYFALPYTGNIMDTTGAGDNFRAGVVYGYLQEWDIDKILSFAMFVGTNACKFYGGCVPTEVDSENWLESFAKSYEVKECSNVTR
ncbi:carbohydrate kinase family protein [Candidatus Uabimicrobium amorphum]|uniref:Ribokinase n=1 Tax=Uabimicrobium amorphum TaxID=2596890 RepID=A0A5S9IP59_UABAM|nr:carbohydrate kinase family protein [Candidatus Uabimicrobium amorphum]BBM84135.1 ribokinase [Candidatus Uabimicrobium amorphum]